MRSRNAGRYPAPRTQWESGTSFSPERLGRRTRGSCPRPARFSRSARNWASARSISTKKRHTVLFVEPRPGPHQALPCLRTGTAPSGVGYIAHEPVPLAFKRDDPEQSENGYSLNRPEPGIPCTAARRDPSELRDPVSGDEYPVRAARSLSGSARVRKRLAACPASRLPRPPVFARVW